MLRIRDFLTGGYPVAKNPDKAKGDAGSKDDALSKGADNSKGVDASKNDVNSRNANIPKNDAVNNNVKDDNATNDSADVKKSKEAVYKSTQSTKEVSKEDKAAAESPANVDKQSKVEPNKDGIYDFSKDENVTNPFQNVITQKEVEELQSKTKSVRPLSSIQKIFYTPYGKNFSVENGQASGDTKSIDEFLNTYNGRLGRIDIFIFFPRVDKDGVYTADGQFYAYRSSRELKNTDGSVNLDLNKAPDGNISYKLEVNGKLVGSNLADKTNIKVYMRKNQTFIHVVMEGSNADEAILGYEGFNHEDSSGAFGYIAFIPECGAQFHFVDDLQYRKVANIKGNGELSQRSSGETDKFSTKPFTKLDLSDLSETKNIAGVRFGNNQVVRGMFTPLLSYEGDPKKDSVKRPTMEELKNTNIPGYLYYSNDIDTPKGGEFTADNTEDFGNYDYGIVRDKDDNQLNTKHYYVTFRPIPTQLVVQYKDSQSKIESGEKYAIYAGNTLVSDTLTSSSNLPTAPTKADLQTMITNSNTTLLSEAAGYLSDGYAYLAPGTYNVKPTADAPENYEWVVDSTDIANAPTDANVNIAVHKDDNLSTQQVVTFVLRRKIATVTFFDGDDSNPYATVKVQKGSSIDGDELKNQSMPKDPSKPGFTFNGWFTGKDGKGTKFTGNTTVSSNISVHSSYISNPPAPTPEPEPEPEPTPEPEPDIDWYDIPDIDLTPDKEPEPTPTPVPDFPVPVAPAPILPPAEAEPEPAPAPAPSQPKQPEQQPKHVAKHLPKTGSTATPVLASAIASLFAGLAGLAESFAATRKRRN
ncbi:hypothetical protein CJI58_003565 [Bifidobacteriaceae bacterium NR047]|nr:hypothetical protein [Bifidobacteriaceae bacterium NR047]